MRALITGANGFIGRTVCRCLKQRGVQVRALLRRKSQGPWDETHLTDFSISTKLSQNIMHGVDVVFHLASKVHALSELVGSEKDEYYRVNVEGTRQLLQIAEEGRVAKFIFFSSLSTMREAEDEIIDELDSPCPTTPYGCSKLDAENLVLNATGIPHITILRPAMVYGPGNPGNLGRMISGIKKGFFPPFPNINNQRSMVHVEDVVQAALLAAENPQAHKQIYIVTDGQAYSTRQIYEWICQALEKPIPNWSVPLPVLQGLAKIGDGIGAVRGKRFMFDSDALAKLTGSAAYSSAKIQRELGFAPKWTLDQALPEIVKAYMNHK